MGVVGVRANSWKSELKEKTSLGRSEVKKQLGDRGAKVNFIGRRVVVPWEGTLVLQTVHPAQIRQRKLHQAPASFPGSTIANSAKASGTTLRLRRTTRQGVSTR